MFPSLNFSISWPSAQHARKEDFFRLLNFARISNAPVTSPTFAHEEKALLELLNSLPQKRDPAIKYLIPLIYHNSIRFGLREKLHENPKKYLRKHAFSLIAAEINNSQKLLFYLKLFHREKIPTILLKGAAFSRSLYPENAPRLGADFDLLVSEEHFETACNLLGRTMKPIVMRSSRITTYESLFERVFVPQHGREPTIELHRGLTNPHIFTIDCQELWRESREHPAYGSELIRILSPEETLLHLAVHAFRDLDFCTHNLLDAHEVWCQWQPNQEKLVDCAKHWGATKVLYYLLKYCEEVMQTPIPETLLAQLKPASVFHVMNKHLLRSKILQDASRDSLRYRLLQLIAQITFPDRLRQGITFQLSYLRTRIKDLTT